MGLPTRRLSCLLPSLSLLSYGCLVAGPCSQPASGRGGPLSAPAARGFVWKRSSHGPTGSTAGQARPTPGRRL